MEFTIILGPGPFCRRRPTGGWSSQIGGASGIQCGGGSFLSCSWLSDMLSWEYFYLPRLLLVHLRFMCWSSTPCCSVASISVVPCNEPWSTLGGPVTGLTDWDWHVHCVMGENTRYEETSGREHCNQKGEEGRQIQNSGECTSPFIKKSMPCSTS